MDKAWEPAGPGAGSPGGRSATIREYLPRWYEDHPRGDRSERSYRSRLGQVLDAEVDGTLLGDWNLRELHRRQVNLLIGKLYEQGRTPGGVRTIVRTLQTMTNDAVNDEYCLVNPWQGIRISRTDKRAQKQPERKRKFKFAALHEWATQAPGPVAAAMLRVLIDGGLRPGELFGLERSHWIHAGERYVNAEDDEVVANGPMLLVRQAGWEGTIVPDSREKNHWRDVPLTKAADELLRAMPVQLRSKWLFTTATGRMWRESNFLRRVMGPTNKAEQH